MNDWRKHEHNTVIPYTPLPAPTPEPPHALVVGSRCFDQQGRLARVVRIVDEQHIQIEAGMFISVLTGKPCPRWFVHSRAELTHFWQSQLESASTDVQALGLKEAA